MKGKSMMAVGTVVVSTVAISDDGYSDVPFTVPMGTEGYITGMEDTDYLVSFPGIVNTFCAPGEIRRM